MNYLVAVDVFFYDFPGGAARVAWDIAKLMKKRGHNVTVFCRTQKSNYMEVSVHEDIKIVRYYFSPVFSLDPFKTRKQIRQGVSVLKRHLSQNKWDVIHIHTPIEGHMVYKAFGSGPKYFYTLHSPAVLECEINWLSGGIAGRIKWMLGRNQIRRLEGELLQKADKIHTLSNFSKSAINGFHGVGDKVTVIPHWCREDFYREYSKQEARHILSWPNSAKILFSVRNLGPRIGMDVAIEAIAPFLKTDDKLFFAIAGTGKLENYLKGLIKTLSVEQKVWFLGQVSDDKLKRCYEASDLFILPTRALECFGLIVLESLTFGLPIVSTDAAAIPELMRSILPNCIVPSGDVLKLREKVGEILDGKLTLPGSEVLVDYVKGKYGAAVIEPVIASFLES